MEVSMTKLDRNWSGIIIASDKNGRNKVRFCESLTRREKLLSQQGFTIHDVIMFRDPANKVDGLRYAVDCEFKHPDSKNLVLKTLAKYASSAKRELILKEIASRPKRNTDLSTEQVMNIVGNL